MIIQQTLERTVWPHNWPIKRWMQIRKQRAQRYLKAQLTFARRRTLAWYRSQYFLNSAYRDMKLSVRRNEDIFVAVLLAASVIGFSLAATGANLLFQAMLAVLVVADAMGLNMAVVFAMAGFAYSLFLAWLIAWMQNMVSIAIWQSSNTNQRRSALRTIRDGLRHTSKITGAWAYILCRAGMPPLVAGILAMISVKTADPLTAPLIAALAVAGTSALILSIQRLLQLTLMPAVMLFEPAQTYKEAALRSTQLVARRGKLFLSFGYLLFALAVAATSSLCWLLFDQLFHINWQVFASVTAIGLAVVANGMLTAFYRKRRLARIH